MSGQYLVLFDADQIKEYVFATGRLKEIRGASEQVRQLTDEPAILKLSGLGRWSVGATNGLIYAGGGAGALLFDDEHAAATFCTELERVFWRETVSATLSAVYVEVFNSDYTAAQTTAAHLLAQRKASHMRAELIPGGGWLRFCASDRVYPASTFDAQDQSFHSAETIIKRRKSKPARTSLKQRGTPERPSFWDRFTVENQAANQWEVAVDHSANQDLGTLGAQSQPEGYVAFVFADGDGIGDLLRHIVDIAGLEGYQEASEALRIGAIEGTAQALRKAYPEPIRPSNLPFEIITIGGDDVILICTAERGLEIACTLSQVFSDVVTGRIKDSLERLLERESATGAPQTVTERIRKALDEQKAVSASVGVVIAHASHPIVNLERRARERLKSAKTAKRGQSGAQAHEGGIDFHIVSTPGLDRIDDIRKEQYAPQGVQDLMFAARPYPVSQMEKLIRHARQFRKLPGSKRSQLYDACLRSPDRISATLAVLRVQLRLGADREKVLDALRDLEVNISYPFTQNPRNGQQMITPLVDLLEAAEFVRSEA